MFDILQYLEGTNTESSISIGEVKWIWEMRNALPLECTILELGVHHGRSACLLAYIATIKNGMYYGIDNFRCDRSSKSEAEGYLFERGLLTWMIMQSDTQTAKFEFPVDFLHVDADHASPGIDTDVSKYLPLIKVGGIVAFDDYAQFQNEPSYPDIARAANTACNNENWHDIGQVDGMKAFKRLK
jgi:predicted O-methyltransferase YrrM